MGDFYGTGDGSGPPDQSGIAPFFTQWLQSLVPGAGGGTPASGFVPLDPTGRHAKPRDPNDPANPPEGGNAVNPPSPGTQFGGSLGITQLMNPTTGGTQFPSRGINLVDVRTPFMQGLEALSAPLLAGMLTQPQGAFNYMFGGQPQVPGMTSFTGGGNPAFDRLHTESPSIFGDMLGSLFGGPQQPQVPPTGGQTGGGSQQPPSGGQPPIPPINPPPTGRGTQPQPSPAPVPGPIPTSSPQIPLPDTGTEIGDTGATTPLPAPNALQTVLGDRALNYLQNDPNRLWNTGWTSPQLTPEGEPKPGIAQPGQVERFDINNRFNDYLNLMTNLQTLQQQESTPEIQGYIQNIQDEIVAKGYDVNPPGPAYGSSWSPEQLSWLYGDSIPYATPTNYGSPGAYYQNPFGANWAQVPEGQSGVWEKLAGMWLSPENTNYQSVVDMGGALSPEDWNVNFLQSGGLLDPNGLNIVGEQGPEAILGNNMVVPLQSGTPNPVQQVTGQQGGIFGGGQQAGPPDQSGGQLTDLGVFNQLLNNNPELQAFQTAEGVLGEGFFNQNPGQGVMDALQPVFQRNLSFGLGELANRAPSVSNSALQLEGTDLTRQALDDFNLLGAQSLQQGLNQQLSGLQTLGGLAGQAGQNPMQRALGVGNLALQGRGQDIGREQGLLNLAQQQQQFGSTFGLQQQQQQFNQTVLPALELLLNILPLIGPTAQQTVAMGG